MNSERHSRGIVLKFGVGIAKPTSGSLHGLSNVQIRQFWIKYDTFWLKYDRFRAGEYSLGPPGAVGMRIRPWE